LPLHASKTPSPLRPRVSPAAESIARCRGACAQSLPDPLSLSLSHLPICSKVFSFGLSSSTIMVRKKNIEGNWKEGTWSLSGFVRSQSKVCFLQSFDLPVCL
jgi:hypothetical protein